jgi:hypothetical protein
MKDEVVLWSRRQTGCQDLGFRHHGSRVKTPLGRQTFEVRRATGADALKGAAGELIISGKPGRVVKADQGCLAYAGLAPDLFASDGAGFGAFRKALWSENRFGSSKAFLSALCDTEFA